MRQYKFSAFVFLCLTMAWVSAPESLWARESVSLDVPVEAAVREAVIAFANADKTGSSVPDLLRELSLWPDQLSKALEKYEQTHNHPPVKTARILYSARAATIKNLEEQFSRFNDPALDVLRDSSLWLNKPALLTAQNRASSLAADSRKAPFTFDNYLSKERERIGNALTGEGGLKADSDEFKSILSFVADNEGKTGRAIRSYFEIQKILLTALDMRARLLITRPDSYFVDGDGKTYFNDKSLEDEVQKTDAILRASQSSANALATHIEHLNDDYMLFCIKFIEEALPNSPQTPTREN